MDLPKDLHPQGGGGGRNRFIPSKAVESGRNAESTGLSDRGHVRCKQCGFMCHIDRESPAETGTNAGSAVVLTSTYGTHSRIDPTVSGGGCPFCGSYRFV